MSVLYGGLWRFWRWGLNLLLPPRCAACDGVGTWLCDECASQLPLFTGPLCPRCGRPWQGQGSSCPVCLETPLRARPIRAAFLFEGPLREVLHAFKYRGGLGVVETLLSSLVRVWREQGMNADFLLPVPLHPARERRRGYNQAEVLALALGRGLGLPVARRGLRRVRNTPSQTRLDRAERRANVSGAFALDEGLSVADRRVALIDDVATTGATLDACAVVLLEAGAAQVSAFTLARAP